MNELKKFLKRNNFQTECEVQLGDIWQEVDIDFLNDQKQLDETSFDIANVLSKSGQSLLSELFNQLCVESGIKHPEIVSVTIVKSSFTYAALTEKTEPN